MLQGLQAINKNLDLYVASMQKKMEDRMAYAMTDAKNDAKQSAPWTDRTGNARISIFGTTSSETNRIIGYLGIGMPYGVYLELAHQGTYRVIWPTIDILRAKLLNILVAGK